MGRGILQCPEDRRFLPALTDAVVCCSDKALFVKILLTIVLRYDTISFVGAIVLSVSVAQLDRATAF